MCKNVIRSCQYAAQNAMKCDALHASVRMRVDVVYRQSNPTLTLLHGGMISIYYLRLYLLSSEYTWIQEQGSCSFSSSSKQPVIFWFTPNIRWFTYFYTCRLQRSWFVIRRSRESRKPPQNCGQRGPPKGRSSTQYLVAVVQQLQRVEVEEEEEEVRGSWGNSFQISHRQNYQYPIPNQVPTTTTTSYLTLATLTKFHI